MVVSDEPKIISNDVIVYKPKPKKVYKSNNIKISPLVHNKKKHHHKHTKKNDNFDLDLKNTRNTKSLNFELISFEEIENDFKELKTRSEKRITGENEILMLLQKTTKNASFDDEERKKTKIERPKNILYKNINDYM